MTEQKEKIQITILGSGTCVPSLKRYPCSVLVRMGTRHILIDAGPGILGQLLKLGVHINDIDMILLSHFHPDHCADITPFLFATKYPVFERGKKLTLAGGTGLNTWFENLNQAYHMNLTLPEHYLNLIELDKKGGMTLPFEGLKLRYAEVCHKIESRAYRLTDSTGFSLVYSGDTDFSENLIDLSEGTDILICESSLPEGHKISGHLTPSLAGEIACRAHVKKLVLTHFYPECDTVDIKAQCRKAFGGPIILAQDLLTL